VLHHIGGKTVLKCFVVVIILLAPNLAAAQSQTEELTCAGDGVLAKIFMRNRQLGGDDLTTMMTKFGEEPGLREMILQAYDHPIMLTPQTRNMAIDEFQNRWVLRCYREGPAVPRTE
jgi:hypothetical protein